MLSLASTFIPGEWMMYGPSGSPMPAVSSLVLEKYATLFEKYLIRKGHIAKRLYVCIPASTWATLSCSHCNGEARWIWAHRILSVDLGGCTHSTLSWLDAVNC